MERHCRTGFGIRLYQARRYHLHTALCEHFWRDKSWCAHIATLVVRIARCVPLREPEVYQLEAEQRVFVAEDIFRLDVAMDDVQAVHALHSLQEVVEELCY